MNKLNILHIDMDAFYASVEEQDHPHLKGKPIIVGGSSNHGVVTTANYVARKYGVHSAMPGFMAKKLCPNGIYLPVRMHRYKEVSRQIFSIYYDFTDLVEPVSVDEAYLDISNLDMDPVDVAKEIKRRVFNTTGLTLSVGISYNKFLAKLASDWNKPNGMKIISYDMVPEILLPLSVKKVHGIGPKSAEKLNNIGIYTIADLLRLSEDFLVGFFGKHGNEIYSRIRGIDTRVIDTERERKSLGTETTFEDTDNKDILKSYLYEFSLEIESALDKDNFTGKTVSLKIKYEDFKVITRSKTLTYFINSANDIYDVAISLLEEVNLSKKVRLIGITVSNLSPADMEQLSFFD
ncbi:MAG: DNA polymerase IV [Tissierella sp.]|nr:DNA polymerase IV [Tissierella sp.]